MIEDDYKKQEQLLKNCKLAFKNGNALGNPFFTTSSGFIAFSSRKETDIDVFEVGVTRNESPKKLLKEFKEYCLQKKKGNITISLNNENNCDFEVIDIFGKVFVKLLDFHVSSSPILGKAPNSYVYSVSKCSK
ncbi:MAG: hypothetical protein ACTSXL_05545 [Alphaproteobacteria bacterium]